jgi:hypothetical protein
MVMVGLVVWVVEGGSKQAREDAGSVRRVTLPAGMGGRRDSEQRLGRWR